MFVFSEEKAVRQATPWGKEVKRILMNRNIKQKELVDHLNEKGFQMNKELMACLLCGVGARAHMPEIHEINVYLGIPEAEDSTETDRA